MSPAAAEDIQDDQRVIRDVFGSAQFRSVLGRRSATPAETEQPRSKRQKTTEAIKCRKKHKGNFLAKNAFTPVHRIMKALCGRGVAGLGVDRL